MGKKKKKMMKRKGHCRKCGYAFKGWAKDSDTCTFCLFDCVSSMNRMAEANAKAEKARLCAPMLSEPQQYSGNSGVDFSLGI